MSIRCSVICLTITEANKDIFGIIPEHFENDIVQPILYCDLVGTLPIQSLELLDTKERGSALVRHVSDSLPSEFLALLLVLGTRRLVATELQVLLLTLRRTVESALAWLIFQGI